MTGRELNSTNAKMIRIVLLITVFAYLADICAASPRTTAFPRTVHSPRTAVPPTTTSPPGPAALPGIIPALLPIAPYIPIPLHFPETQSFPSPTIKPSLETVASLKTKGSPKTARSPQISLSRRITAPPKTNVSPKTVTSLQMSSSRRNAASGRTVSSTTTAVSRKNSESLSTKSATTTTKSPRTTPSAKTTASTTIDNTTEEIFWEPTNLQKFPQMLEKNCDFYLLNAISEDLKNLWDEVKKEIDEPMSSKMNDKRTLLKKIIDFYNDCIEAMDDIDLERQWDIYLKIFGKEYNAKATEKEMRKEIFKKNMEEVREHNELYKKGRVTYKAGLNHLSDRTEEELKKMNGLRATNPTPHGYPKRKERFVDEYILKIYYYNANFPAPASSDWRIKGRYVTPVANQGDCDACYAFAGIGALEAYHKKNAGELVKLSVQNILDCTWHLGNNGCVDGKTDTVFHYAERIGVVSNFHYPYTMNASHNCQWRWANVVANVNGYYVVEPDSELALQSAVAIQGPIAASIGTRHLSRYRSGIFTTEDCGDINHAVLIVGYGTDPRHGDFWIAKNCWGYWWGEDGYFRIARNRNNMCNISSYALFPY